MSSQERTLSFKTFLHVAGSPTLLVLYRTSRTFVLLQDPNEVAPSHVQWLHTFLALLSKTPAICHCTDPICWSLSSFISCTLTYPFFSLVICVLPLVTCSLPIGFTIRPLSHPILLLLMTACCWCLLMFLGGSSAMCMCMYFLC